MNYYTLLGVPRDAEAPQIEKAYRDHLANGVGGMKRDQLEEALEVLNNPISRKAYDEELAEDGVVTKGEIEVGGRFTNPFWQAALGFGIGALAPFSILAGPFLALLYFGGAEDAVVPSDVLGLSWNNPAWIRMRSALATIVLALGIVATGLTYFSGSMPLSVTHTEAKGGVMGVIEPKIWWGDDTRFGKVVVSFPPKIFGDAQGKNLWAAATVLNIFLMVTLAFRSLIGPGVLIGLLGWVVAAYGLSMTQVADMYVTAFSYGATLLAIILGFLAGRSAFRDGHGVDFAPRFGSALILALIVTAALIFMAKIYYSAVFVIFIFGMLMIAAATLKKYGLYFINDLRNDLKTTK